jgi:hypothetical protein
MEKYSRLANLQPVQQQHSLPSCVGMSGYIVVAEARGDTTISAQELYDDAQRFDEWPGEDYLGTSISGALTSLLADNSIAGYASFLPQNYESFKQELKQGCLWFSVKTGHAFHTGRENGRLGIFSDPTSFNGDRAAHAMVITGYAVIEGTLYFEVRNSWGEQWGLQGNCYIKASLLPQICNGWIYRILHESEVSKKEVVQKKKKAKKQKLVIAAGIATAAIIAGAVYIALTA